MRRVNASASGAISPAPDALPDANVEAEQKERPEKDPEKRRQDPFQLPETFQVVLRRRDDDADEEVEHANDPNPQDPRPLEVVSNSIPRLPCAKRPLGGNGRHGRHVFGDARLLARARGRRITKPQQGRRGMTTYGLEQLTEMRGANVYSVDGDKIGSVEDVYVDEQTRA